MDLKGQIKEYVARDQSGMPTHFFNVILLNQGVIPFTCHFPDGQGGMVPANCNAFLTLKRAFVTHAFYRPTAEAFASLDRASQEHVVKGGLLMGPLDEARVKGVIEGIRLPKIDDFQGWISYLKVLYGAVETGDNGST